MSPFFLVLIIAIKKINYYFIVIWSRPTNEYLMLRVRMSKITVLCVLLMAEICLSCVPPDCDHPDCGSCGI